MAFKRFFLGGCFLILAFLSTCKETPSDPDPGPPQVSVEITAPSATQTYWTDQSVPCVSNQPDYKDKTTWLVDGEAVACAGGELDTQLTAGEYTVTTRIADEGESIEANVTITVKEGFSVSLDKPKSGAEFFVGDAVACVATIEPAKYEEYLSITVDGKDCTAGETELTEAGETTVRAFATVDGRTEADEAVVVVKQAVAGRVYPLTSDGVQNGAGFTVTLRAGGEALDVQTDADGHFSIRSEAISELGDEMVTLEVAESADFYGSKAVLPADELLALAERRELGFILAPRRWHIRNGKLAGNSAKLQLRAAFTRVIADDGTSSFYKLWKVFGKYKYISVFSENLPLLKAFNRTESEVKITASDSTDFWKQTNNVTEPYIGRGDLFTSATISQVPSNNDGFRVKALKAGDRSSASGFPGESDHISGGYMNLAIDKFGGFIQTHEQIHNLSFGHASQWDGIMTYEIFDPTGRRIRVPGRGMKRLSVDDVAHIQVYIDAFDLQFSRHISFGVLEWMQALDIEGLPETTSSQEKTYGKYAGSYHYETIECRIH